MQKPRAGARGWKVLVVSPAPASCEFRPVWRRATCGLWRRSVYWKHPRCANRICPGRIYVRSASMREPCQSANCACPHSFVAWPTPPSLVPLSAKATGFRTVRAEAARPALLPRPHSPLLPRPRGRLRCPQSCRCALPFRPRPIVAPRLLSADCRAFGGSPPPARPQPIALSTLLMSMSSATRL